MPIVRHRGSPGAGGVLIWDALLDEARRRMQAGQFQSALRLYAAARELSPYPMNERGPTAAAAVGMAQCALKHELRELPLAVEAYRAVLTVRDAAVPQVVVANLFVGLADAYLGLGDVAEAERCVGEALGRDPSLPLAHHTRAEVALARGDRDTARHHFARVAAADPHDPSPNVIGARGTARLRLYDWGGFSDTERALQDGRVAGEAMARRHCARNTWDGSPFEGTLLVTQCGGFGDIIQYARFLTAAAARSSGIALAVPSVLVPLLQTLGGPVAFVGNEDPGPFAARVDITHLPAVLAPLAISGGPYLTARHNRQPLPTRPGFRVGIMWAAGDRDRDSYANRSSPFLPWLRLLEIPGVSVYSLQLGKPADEIRCLGPRLVHAGELGIRDWGDTSAVLVGLDLVITVDSAVAHCAGALGRPAWVLLPALCDWRWGIDGERTPWYDSVRLFRQRSEGDWPELLDRVARELAALAAAAGACR